MIEALARTWFTILIEKRARQFLKKLPRKTRRIAVEKVQGLAEDPYPGGNRERFEYPHPPAVYRLHQQILHRVLYRRAGGARRQGCKGHDDRESTWSTRAGEMTDIRGSTIGRIYGIRAGTRFRSNPGRLNIEGFFKANSTRYKYTGGPGPWRRYGPP